MPAPMLFLFLTRRSRNLCEAPRPSAVYFSTAEGAEKRRGALPECAPSSGRRAASRASVFPRQGRDGAPRLPHLCGAARRRAVRSETSPRKRSSQTGSFLAVMIVFILIFISRVPAQAEELPPLATEHEARSLQGWTVRVDRRLMEGA